MCARCQKDAKHIVKKLARSHNRDKEKMITCFLFAQIKAWYKGRQTANLCPARGHFWDVARGDVWFWIWPGMVGGDLWACVSIVGARFEKANETPCTVSENGMGHTVHFEKGNKHLAPWLKTGWDSPWPKETMKTILKGQAKHGMAILALGVTALEPAAGWKNVKV